MKTKKVMMIALVSSSLALSGCGAMGTAIKKRNLEVKTQMSETIWLELKQASALFSCRSKTRRIKTWVDYREKLPMPSKPKVIRL